MDMQPPKLLDQVRMALHAKHYSYRTEKAYVNWIKRFILFHNQQHPKDLNSLEIEEFLTHLAVRKSVSPSTQNQALAAILFLYHTVLRQPLDRPIDAVRAKSPERLPTVMTKDEVDRVLAHLPETYQLNGKLMYGCGLRL